MAKKVTSSASKTTVKSSGKSTASSGPSVTSSPRDPRGGIHDPNYGQGRTIIPGSSSSSLPPAWSSQTPGQYMPRPGSIAGKYMF